VEKKFKFVLAFNEHFTMAFWATKRKHGKTFSFDRTHQIENNNESIDSRTEITKTSFPKKTRRQSIGFVKSSISLLMLRNKET
jgi:hypothetical protein